MSMTVLDIVGEDFRYFEQAVQQYREATSDYSKFVELHREARHEILERAQQLKDAEEKLVAA